MEIWKVLDDSADGREEKKSNSLVKEEREPKDTIVRSEEKSIS